MAIWELDATSELYPMVGRLVERYHSHLSEARITLYANDKNRNKANKIIIAEASKASAKMKASTNADFTLTVYMTPWSDLTMSQKKACLDHELCHCGVHYEPVKEAVGSGRGGRQRFKVVRDEYGRIQYTNEIKRNENGEPKWRLLPHDLEEFRDIVARHGIWDEDIQAFKEVLDRNSVNNFSITAEESRDDIETQVADGQMQLADQNFEIRSTN